MERGAIVTFWFATLLYAAATVLYGYYFVDKRRRLAWYATFATGAGFLMHTASIGLRWAQKGSFPFEGPFESLLIAAWALILIYFAVEHLFNVKVLGTLAVPAALVAMVIAQLNFDVPVGETADVLDSWRVGIHVVVINLANAGFAIGAGASVLYLVQEAQLKSHRTNVFFRRLPSLATTDRLSRQAIAWGFPAYTAGILLGTIRAAEFDLAGWYLDPRVMLAFTVWVIFGAYLYLRASSRIGGRVAAWLALVGLVAVVALAIVARTVPSGFHIFGG
jgi:ABC-type transport system involved in cytochrome c biogenesis permease subunit